MNYIGIIDIGANSVRLMLAKINSDGFYQIIDELNTPIRLCEDLILNDCISEDKISSTIATLTSYKTLCEVSGATKIYAVANDSLQQAKNKEQFFQKIFKELSLEIRFLTPYEDILLTFSGVKSGIYLDCGLIVDIEGSSTHIIQYENGNIINSAYLPIGSVNISYNFCLNDRILKEDILNAKEYIYSLLNEYPWLNTLKSNTIIGVGGTFRALGRINRFNRKYLLDITHNYKMDDRDFSDSFNMLKTKDLRQRKKIDGLSCNRADIITGGALIVKCIIEKLSETNIIISSRGLRDGIIESILTDNKATKDILDYSIDGLISSLNLNKIHAYQVYKLTKCLFEKLSPLHGLDISKYNNIIKTASILHDCGTSIDYTNHHKHSFYIILNSPLAGLSHKELISAASIAAIHRNNRYSLPLPQFSYLLNRLDFSIIEKIGVLLRISEGLDRTLVSAIIDIDVEILDNTVILYPKSHNCISLEVTQALRSSTKFNEIYGRELKIIPIKVD
ncbi:MAG: Ppx/GppA phosphatase family protein [Clostridium sp.]